MHVFDRLGDVKLLIEPKGLLKLFFAIAELDIRLHAPKKIRREDCVSFFGVIVRDIADMPVDAKDLLQQQNSRTRANLRSR